MKRTDEPQTPPIVIDPTRLAPETLDNLIDSFIQREGTDYGWNETSLATKRQQVHKQLSQDEIKIVFDPASESVTLLHKSDLRHLLG